MSNNDEAAIAFADKYLDEMSRIIEEARTGDIFFARGKNTGSTNRKVSAPKAPTGFTRITLKVPKNQTEDVNTTINQDNVPKDTNDYILQWAAYNGHLKIVEYMVSLGVDIHTQNNYALRLATNQGHLDIVKYLANHED